jgi:hypothetical protein
VIHRLGTAERPNLPKIDQRGLINMPKRLTAVLLSSAAAALALSLGSTTAMASSIAATWTVSPGGTVSASGSGQVKDAKTGTIAKCTSIKVGGTLKKGSGLSGAGIGSITSASFTGCTIGAIAVTVKIGTGSLPWELNALSYNATTGVTTGSLEDIDLRASATGCTAALDGTALGANNGLTKFTYTNSTGKLKLVGTGGNLHSWGVVGCFGLVNNGDVQQASGTETVSPKQTIHSP